MVNHDRKVVQKTFAKHTFIHIVRKFIKIRVEVIIYNDFMTHLSLYNESFKNSMTYKERIGVVYQLIDF